MSKSNYYIKTNRSFTNLRRSAWIFTLLVAVGGLWEPKLGLFVFLIMASLLVSAFFNGRYWCGNVCPHGSLFDNLLLPLSRNRQIPHVLKSKWFIGGFFIFFMFNFTRKLLQAFSFWGNYDFLDKLGFVMVGTYLVVLIIGGTLALLVTPRTWCQFCPMGTMQKGSHALGKSLGVAKKTEKKIAISDQEKCRQCGKCSRVCPFQLTPYLEFAPHNQFDNINCIKCGTCVNNCPAKILSLEKEKPIQGLPTNEAQHEQYCSS
ncbi:MAG: 4Fe-4S binding protein [Dehalobacterium sp.]|jgi:ferredoxin-type protein NapH